MTPDASKAPGLDNNGKIINTEEVAITCDIPKRTYPDIP